MYFKYISSCLNCGFLFILFFSAGLQPVSSATPPKKTSKKSLSELHKELLKKAECLNLTTPAEQPAELEGGTDIPHVSVTVDHSRELKTDTVEGVCIDADSDGTTNAKSVAAISNGSVENSSSKCERSKSRKAAKPMKREQEPTMELVDIRPVQKLPAQCRLCSYACMNNVQLDVHAAEVHGATQHPDRTLQPYSCPLCSWFGSTKEAFKRHVAHHPGKHVVRYHTCQHCLFCTTVMSVVEDHLPVAHPGDSFRFEVLQETVACRQNLVECPVCQGLYLWQQDLSCHFREYHNLESVAAYMESAFPEQSELSTMSVPKELFNDLLERYAAGVEANDTDGGPVSPEKVDDSSSTWSVDVVSSKSHQTPDVGTVIRFHCSNCDFNSENFDLFRKHCASHTAAASAAAKGSGNFGSSASMLGIPTKSGFRSTYHCHLCPFECSKMVHYRRHLEIHERNQSLAEGFRCGYCHFAHYRQNCVKFHLGKYHGDRPIKMSRITDGVEVELSETDLYAMRSRKGQGDNRSHQSSTSSSLLVLRSDKEKRPTSRYESGASVPLLAVERTSSTKLDQQWAAEKDSPVADQPQTSFADLEEANQLLNQFEQDLPGSMIYADPVKCPRCDFTNRVRVNMIRHLKLHRDEDSALFGMSNSLRENAGGHFDLQKNGHLESGTENERPLLRQILSEKPLVCVMFVCLLSFVFSSPRRVAHNSKSKQQDREKK